ncbi:MAG TPA: ABC transporter ATP-binding protein [Ktedonobacteraceae bacterium]|nr:ABC transporter ATP-binding protein [Ktedonobacteraceae bacterium]
MESKEIVIEAHELRRTFKAQEAVAGIHFCVQRGEIFGLLGPNGAGKTTTIRMLTGQIVPTSGHATVAGYDVVRARQQLKECIGVVPEEQNLYERLSAYNNLKFSCWLYNLPTSRAYEVLDLVRLRERAKDPVRAFSNGMRQRLMIARALLHRPPVLFLDEPSRGLDPISAREVRGVIDQLRQAGTTILLTTHLLEEADQLCQHIAFINAGRIVANDTPRHLKLAHGQRTLLVTLANQDASDNSFEEITLSMDDPHDQARLTQLMAQGLVQAVHSQEATLEEVFVKIAGVRPA